MIVCSCHGITDTEIRRELSAAGQGPCLAGTGCGNCLPLVADIVRKMRNTEGRGAESSPGRRSPHAAPSNATEPHA